MFSQSLTKYPTARGVYHFQNRLIPQKNKYETINLDREAKLKKALQEYNDSLLVSIPKISQERMQKILKTKQTRQVFQRT